jgi:hypothetical protein
MNHELSKQFANSEFVQHMPRVWLTTLTYTVISLKVFDVSTNDILPSSSKTLMFVVLDVSFIVVSNIWFNMKSFYIN